MPEFLIDSFEDSRLDRYGDRKAPASRARETFVAEGEKLVLRLLDSACRTESILCTRAALDRLRDRIPADIPVYIAGTPVISALIGFQFHRGILACGRRPADKSLSELCGALAEANRCLLVLCPEIRDPANLGTIIRTAGSFGAAGVVAGRAGTDPFSRRVLRTSMGSVLRMPIVQTDDWNEALATLHRSGFESIATVLDQDAALLQTSPCPPRAAIFLGNE